MKSLLYLPRNTSQHVWLWYSRIHPTSSSLFVTSSFFQKDLYPKFCSWKVFPSTLPLLSIFLQKTLLVVVESWFCAISTTTQRPLSRIMKGSIPSPDRRGGGSMFGRKRRRISRLCPRVLIHKKNETSTNCVTTPCMDMKTKGIPPCTGHQDSPDITKEKPYNAKFNA